MLAAKLLVGCCGTAVLNSTQYMFKALLNPVLSVVMHGSLSEGVVDDDMEYNIHNSCVQNRIFAAATGYLMTFELLPLQGLGYCQL